MKKLVRRWLGIDQEVYVLTSEHELLYKKFHALDASYCELDEKIDNIESDVSNSLRDLEYEIEERPTRYDVEDIVRDEALHPDDIDEHIDYEQIYDNVFDLVMREIENRDTLKELVSAEVESFTSTTEAQGYPVDVDINEIVEEVIEAVVRKLQS